eukprot:10540849-Alexandrium_andersonii.AAC.1
MGLGATPLTGVEATDPPGRTEGGATIGRTDGLTGRSPGAPRHVARMHTIAVGPTGRPRLQAGPSRERHAARAGRLHGTS